MENIFSILVVGQGSCIISGKFDENKPESVPEILNVLNNLPSAQKLKVKVLVGCYKGQLVGDKLSAAELALIRKMLQQMVQQGSVVMLEYREVELAGRADTPKPAVPPKPPLFCHSCGSRITAPGAFCEFCGAQLYLAAKPQAETVPAQPRTNPAQTPTQNKNVQGGPETVNLSKPAQAVSSVPSENQPDNLAKKVVLKKSDVPGSARVSNRQEQAAPAQTGNAPQRDTNGFVISDNKLISAKGVTGDVVVPQGIESIENNAFSGCSGITSLVLPGSLVRIERNAFLGCSGLHVLNIPESVKVIEDDAFLGCTGVVVANWPSWIREKPWLLEFIADPAYLGRDRIKCCRACGGPISKIFKCCVQCRKPVS